MNHKLVLSIPKNKYIFEFKCLSYRDVFTYILYCGWGKTKECLTYLQMYILISLRAELIFIIFPSLIIFDTPWVFSYCMVLWCTKGQNIFISAQSFLPTLFASGNIASRCWIRKKQLYGNPPY